MDLAASHRLTSFCAQLPRCAEHTAQAVPPQLAPLDGPAISGAFLFEIRRAVGPGTRGPWPGLSTDGLGRWRSSAAAPAAGSGVVRRRLPFYSRDRVIGSADIGEQGHVGQSCLMRSLIPGGTATRERHFARLPGEACEKCDLHRR